MLDPLQVSFAKVVKSTQYFVYIRVCLVHWFVKSLTGLASDFLNRYFLISKYHTSLIIAVLLEVVKSGSVLLMFQYCVNFFLFLFLRQDLVFPRLASNFLLAEEDLELLIPLPKPTSRVLGLRVCVYMAPFL